MVTKDTTKPATAKAPKKPRAATAKKAVETTESVSHAQATHEVKHEAKEHKDHAGKGKYIFATGRRKTAIANVRLFSGHGDSTVNHKPLKKYFNYAYYLESIDRPFNVTGLGKDYNFVAHVSGGGPNAQAEAVRHGISLALSTISEEVRRVLKKNGLLTRDDRKKERKKPGLKRARRSPQWSKR
jgi:small subunit ribosomal protein S9